MANKRMDFDNRIEQLTERHAAMGQGYSASLRNDGLIVVQPKRMQFKLPVRGFVLLMIVFMCFKGFVLAALGGAGYHARLDVLRSGTAFEQAGAFVMGVDPVSQALANLLAPILKKS